MVDPEPVGLFRLSRCGLGGRRLFGAGMAPACGLPVSRSITERTGSRALRSRTALSSGAAAPERRISASASGSIIGSSHEPCTKKGSSNGVAPVRVAVTSAAVPLRSRSRAGIEAEPASASFTARPSIFISCTVAMPFTIFSVDAILSYGVRPVRKSPPPESGRRSSRRSSCSTSSPAARRSGR